MGVTNLEIVKKMGTKNLQNGGPNPPKSSPEGPKREPGSQNPKKKTRSNNNKRCLWTGRPFLNEKVANMAPSWFTKSNQNRRKIDAKMDQKNDASWNRFLEGFWWIFGGKMDACWHQNRTKIDANFD